jgi:uncharacterized repeat protein (TIGR02543 family)
MSKNKLATIIVVCTIAVVAAIVLVSFRPWERAYTLDVVVNPPQAGSVSPAGGQYKSSEEVTLTASPASGYTFDSWCGSTSGTSPTITIAMDGDQTITANFMAQYDLMIGSTTGGNVSAPGEGIFPDYDAGTVVELVATAEEGYGFTSWTGDVSAIADVHNAESTITMNGDYSITAEFAPVYELTISSSAGGSVITPGEGTFTYGAGTIVELSARADEGYDFVDWTGDVGTIDYVNYHSAGITMDSGKSITANFEPEPPPTPEVEYKITGTASKVFVTLSNGTGGTEQFDNVYVPHTYTFQTFTNWFLYVSAQNLGESGSVTVTIYLNGAVVGKSTSSGAYVIADASYSRL